MKRLSLQYTWKKESAWQQNLTSENAGHGRTPIYPIKINLCEQVKPNYFKKQRSSSLFLKFSFSEKATKICAICLMVLSPITITSQIGSCVFYVKMKKIGTPNLIIFFYYFHYRLMFTKSNKIKKDIIIYIPGWFMCIIARNIKKTTQNLIHSWNIFCCFHNHYYKFLLWIIPIWTLNNYFEN